VSHALASCDRLIAANFSDAQARAIIDAMATELVTREYLDARLQAVELKMEALGHRIVGTFTTRLLQAAGLIIVLNGIVTAVLDKLAR